MAIVLTLGRSWRTSSNRFGPSEAKKNVTPVTLPPDGPRLGTRPNSTGSPPAVKTIGMVDVAALAAFGDGSPHLWQQSQQPDAGPVRQPTQAIDHSGLPPSDTRW